MYIYIDLFLNKSKMLKKIMKKFFYMLKNKHRIIIDDLEEKKKYFIHIYIYLITKFYFIVRKLILELE